MLDDAGEFDGGEPDIDGHHDGPGQQNAEVAFEELMIVEAEVRHPVAGLDAQGQQAGREAFAALAELPVCETAGAVDYPDFVAV